MPMTMPVAALGFSKADLEPVALIATPTIAPVGIPETKPAQKLQPDFLSIPKPSVAHEEPEKNPPEKTLVEEITFQTNLEPVLEIDIPTLLHLVEDNSLSLDIAKAQVLESKWGLVNSVSKLLPSASIYNYYERYRGADIFIGQNPFKVNRDTYQTKYAASYNVQLGGKDLFDIKSSWHAMNRMKRMQDVSYKQAILDLLTQYNIYLRDISAVQVAQESVRQAEVQLRLSESRFHTGFTTKLDVTQARTLLAEKQGDLLRTKNQKLATEYGMASMLKLAIGVRLKPLDTSLKPIQLVDSSLTLPALFQLAITHRPDVKAVVDNINEAKSRYAATRAQLFPTVSVSGFKRRIGPENQLQPSHEMFASISYDAGRNMGLDVISQMGQDKARIKAAMLQKEKQLYDIQKELSETYLSSDMYRAQMNISEQKVEAANESFRIARHRRLSGAGINLDVIQAENDLAQARQDYFTAVMNFNISQLKVLFQTGQLTPQRVLTALTFTY